MIVPHAITTSGVALLLVAAGVLVCAAIIIIAVAARTKDLQLRRGTESIPVWWDQLPEPSLATQNPGHTIT